MFLEAREGPNIFQIYRSFCQRSTLKHSHDNFFQAAYFTPYVWQTDRSSKSNLTQEEQKYYSYLSSIIYICKMQAFRLLPLQAMQWLVVIYIHRTTSLSLAIIPIFHDKTDQRRDICTNSAYTMIFYCVLWVLIGWSSYKLMHLSMRDMYTWYMTGTVHVHCTMGCQVFVWFCPAPKMRRSLNSPFLVQRYILEELSVAPSIPVISYIKVSDASFTKFSLIPLSAHTVCQKSKLCSLISHHLARHCITTHHIALHYTTSHPTAPHTASAAHCIATHGKVCGSAPLWPLCADELIRCTRK